MKNKPEQPAKPKGQPGSQLKIGRYRARSQAKKERIAALAQETADLVAPHDRRNARLEEQQVAKVTKGAHEARRASPAAERRKSKPKPPNSPFLKRKPEQTVQLTNESYLEIRGLSSPEHTRYVYFSDGSNSALTRYDGWHGGSGDAARQLAASGITIVLDMKKVREAVGVLKRFPVVPIAEKPGWAGPIFAPANGRVIAPATVKRSFVAFTADPDICASGGTIEGWVSGVAEPLAPHLLASFIVMVMFAGPLLRHTSRADNFGFELAGAAGLGKSTVQMLAASAAGRAFGSEGSTYWRTCNATINALESTLPYFSDMTLVLDEAGLIPGGGKQDERASQMRELVFRLASGRARHRYGERPKPTVRLISVLSTNEALSTLVGRWHVAEAQALADRLMTLPLIEDRPCGIFDSVPSGYASTAAFADALKREACEHYGHAVPAFLAYLVDRRARSPKWLDRVLRSRLERFNKAARIDTNNGSQVRVGSAFGLVYVAGLMAKWAGVLPATYQPKRAALAAYRLHRDHGRVTMSFSDRLRALARHPATIDLDEVDAETVDEEARAACLTYLYTNRSGGRELLIPARMRGRAIPDWNRIRNESDVVLRLKVSEGDRNTNDRPIPGAKKEVYCFDVSDLSV